jgi:hypothetical protein
MASYLTRDVRTYLDKVRESSYNTPQTTGTNYERLVTTNAVVPIPNQEIRTDQGRAGSEFASAVCNTYWEPTTISVSGDGDFAGMGRLALRAVGGTITDATVVTSLAFSHTAPMLPGSSGLQLPSFNMIAAIESSGASYLYTGCVVDRMRLTKEAGQIAQLSFDILGSGKHRGPHAVTSLPSAPSFSCLRPYGYVSYDNGSPINLSAWSAAPPVRLCGDEIRVHWLDGPGPPDDMGSLARLSFRHFFLCALSPRARADAEAYCLANPSWRLCPSSARD